MTDDNTFKLEKMIMLNKLKQNEYCLWVIQMEARFEVHKCLDIALGKESNSTSVNDDGISIGSIGV